nr:module 2 specificity determinant [Pseudomonas aeruginosa]WHT11909.1 module 2 specificity determinant [Pseudomonas aeruginosa]
MGFWELHRLFCQRGREMALMKFLLKPDLQVGLPGQERVSSVSVNGLRLTIDGVEFDFSPLAVGGYLPPEAYINITPLQEVEVRSNFLLVRYIHQVTADILTAYRAEIEPILVEVDGPVELPK